MLTKLIVHNFKQLEHSEIELGNPVVFVGPNDSGKTSALQALALWDLGLRRWVARRIETDPKKRSGVTIGRGDLVALPVPSARQLWRELAVRQQNRTPETGKNRTENIRIEITVEGYDLNAKSYEPSEIRSALDVETSQPPNGPQWKCGLEFDFANPESFYCRPLRSVEDGSARIPIPPDALNYKVVFLGPMSGLAANERRLEKGAIDVLLGEGRTAEVLRNLCYEVLVAESGQSRWANLAERIEQLFHVKLDNPRHIAERGEIELTYRTPKNSRLDLSSSGRGMHQTLLLLAFLELNPGSVVLLDEPDAHMEVLRQQQAYNLLSESAEKKGTQIIVASHSEVILREAAARGTVIAFVGSPHKLNKHENIMKALSEIGFDEYYQAETTGFVLYLEGSTDLAILRSFARLLDHNQATRALERPFVKYVANNLSAARRHFSGLREANPNLVGFALFDRLDRGASRPPDGLVETQWQRREIENYLLPSRSLERWARRQAQEHYGSNTLFAQSEGQRWAELATNALADHVPPAALRDEHADYWRETKISDSLLKTVFHELSEQLQIPLVLRKGSYHQLVDVLEAEEVDSEVIKVLNLIAKQAKRAIPGSRLKRVSRNRL
ncbi:MAG: AAA family ATPase [Acidimicrobiia bacterium]|nr:AAA family ATPase [Acidimicrobiia bacterium]